MHGGSGGIGTFALQLAALFGARVFCTASGAKRAQCEALGAERAIDYESEDFAAILEAEGGADVICDTIGAKYLGRNLRALALDGRIVTIGLLGGRRGEVDLAELLTKRGTMCGVTLRSQSAAAKGFLIAEVREMLWPLLDAGRLRPVVDRAFALADAREAHEYMATGAHVGKVLLVP
jgi:NADPH:quinone reductase-like Zn-dependent oxidoreductase